MQKNLTVVNLKIVLSHFITTWHWLWNFKGEIAVKNKWLALSLLTLLLGCTRAQYEIVQGKKDHTAESVGNQGVTPVPPSIPPNGVGDPKNRNILNPDHNNNGQNPGPTEHPDVPGGNSVCDQNSGTCLPDCLKEGTCLPPCNELVCVTPCDPDTGCEIVKELYTAPDSPQVDIIWMVSTSDEMDRVRNQFNDGIERFSATFLERAPKSNDRDYSHEISYKMAVSVLNSETNQTFASFNDPFTASCDDPQDGSIGILYRGSNGTFVNSPQTLSSEAYRQDIAKFRFLFSGDTSLFECSSWDSCQNLQGSTSALAMGIIPGTNQLPAQAKLLPGLDFAHIKAGYCQSNLFTKERSAQMMWQTLVNGNRKHHKYLGVNYPNYEWELFPSSDTSKASRQTFDRWTVFVVVTTNDDSSDSRWSEIGQLGSGNQTFLGSMTDTLGNLGRDPQKLRIHTVTPNHAERLRTMASRTHGRAFDISDDFGPTLGHLGDEFVYEANSMPLTGKVPQINGQYRIKVSFDGEQKVEGTDWIYDAQANSIRFMVVDEATNSYKTLNRPKPGTRVEITYETI